MVRTISVDETDLRTLFDTDEPVIVQDQGEPRLVVMSPEEYERLRDAGAESDWQAIQRLQARNADKDPDDVLREVTAIVAEVRQERHERRQRDSSSR